MPDDDRPLAIPPAEAARLLNVSRGLVYKLLASGELPSVKLGRRRLIRRDSLRMLLEAKEERP
jgi:excisionase family DNA binding protein